jgi:tRNA(fMet)-specific endonuclease VapC
LEFGIVNSERPDQNRIALVEFLTPFEILNYDDRAAKEYGVIRKYLEESGAPIGALDTLIAAHALSLDCPLVTNNEREFSRVPGLRVENWAKIT